jgi:hypothetical protein
MTGSRRTLWSNAGRSQHGVAQATGSHCPRSPRVSADNYRLSKVGGRPTPSEHPNGCLHPRLGCPGFTYPVYMPSPGGDISKSLFFPDEAINEHPRFPILTANIRRRRGSKVAINVPSKLPSLDHKLISLSVQTLSLSRVCSLALQGDIHWV